MQEHYYNFTQEGRNRGYSYLFLSESKLYSYTRFRLSNAALFTNVFELKLSQHKILACKHGNTSWIDLSHLPHTHYPSCAYPLYLPQVMNTVYKYIQVSEDDGSIVGHTVLVPEGNDITESQGGQMKRRFTMDGDTPIAINWGGAISYICSDAEESVEGCDVEFYTDLNVQSEELC